MEESQLIIHYRHHVQGFHQHFKQASEQLGMENVHQLRLDIKKMRATLALMQFVSNNALDPQEYFALLSKLFQCLGQVRETQINQDLILKDNGPGKEQLLEFFKRLQLQAEAQLRTEMGQFDFKKLDSIHRSLLGSMQPTTNEQAAKGSLKYIIKKMMQVEALKSQLNEPKKLHKVRIHLKEVSEILVLINEIQKTPELETVAVDIKTVTTMIGEWHDYRILLDDLENMTEADLPGSQPGQLSALVQQLQHRTREMQEQIKQKLLDTLTAERIKNFQDLL